MRYQAGRRQQDQEPLPKTEQEGAAPQFQLPEGVASYYNLQRKNQITVEMLQKALAGLGIQPKDAKKKPGSHHELQEQHDVALATMLSHPEPKAKAGVQQCIDQMKQVQIAIDEYQGQPPSHEEFAKIAGAIEALLDMAALCNDNENPWDKDATVKKKEPEKKAPEKKEPELDEEHKQTTTNHSAPGFESLGASEKKAVETGLKTIPTLTHFEVDKQRAHSVLPEQETALDALANIELDVKAKVEEIELLLDAAVEALKTVASWSVNQQLSQIMNELLRARTQLQKLVKEIAQQIEDKRRLVQTAPPRQEAVEKDEEELRKSEDLDRKDKEAQSTPGKEDKKDQREERELENEVKTKQVEEKKLEKEAAEKPEKQAELKEKKSERKDKQAERKDKERKDDKKQRSTNEDNWKRSQYAQNVPEESLFVGTTTKNHFYAFDRDEMHGMLNDSTARLRSPGAQLPSLRDKPQFQFLTNLLQDACAEYPEQHISAHGSEFVEQEHHGDKFYQNTGDHYLHLKEMQIEGEPKEPPLQAPRGDVAKDLTYKNMYERSSKTSGKPDPRGPVDSGHMVTMLEGYIRNGLKDRPDLKTSLDPHLAMIALAVSRPEVRRNHNTVLINEMLIDLVKNGVLTFEQAFGGDLHPTARGGGENQTASPETGGTPGTPCYNLEAGLLIKWLCATNPVAFRYTFPQEAQLITDVDRREEARGRILTFIQKWLMEMDSQKRQEKK